MLGIVAPVRAAVGAFLPARPQLADNVARHESALLRIGHESPKAPGNLSHHRRRPRSALDLAWRRIATAKPILEFADERRRDLRKLDLAEGGHTTPDQLRLAVIPRKAIPELKKQGLSNRKIAKLSGVSKDTVARDLGRGAGAPKSGADAPNDVSLATPSASFGEFETIVIDPPWPMTKIERDVRPNQAGFSYLGTGLISATRSIKTCH